jgi:preprotein translocase subunit SecY
MLRAVAGHNDPLVGGLIEEYGRGRTRLWFWQQVLDAVVVHTPRPVGLAFLVLSLYLAGSYIAIPGARDVLQSLMTQRSTGPGPSSLFTVFFLGGGEMSWGTIFTLGVAPYISAAFIVQIVEIVWSWVSRNNPHRRPLPVLRLTWLVALLLCLSQAAGFAMFLERVSLASAVPIVQHPGLMFRATTVLVLTAGTICLMFISDQISKHQRGNGMLIVFVAGTLGSLPGLAGWLVSGAVDPFMMLSVLAINTTMVAAISYGYQRAIVREVAS